MVVRSPPALWFTARAPRSVFWNRAPMTRGTLPLWVSSRIPKRYSLRKPAEPTIYIPLRTTGTIQVRAGGDPAALGSRLREEVRATDQSFRVTSITSSLSRFVEALLFEVTPLEL